MIIILNEHNDTCFEDVVSYFEISSGTLFRIKLYLGFVLLQLGELRFWPLVRFGVDGVSKSYTFNLCKPGLKKFRFIRILYFYAFFIYFLHIILS